ncbi:MAG TPA: hypothetical protein VLC09_02215 [Polyangiaceae bacterium]|nr:hypothetical protein [Polyangiaceae bacterium]
MSSQSLPKRAAQAVTSFLTTHPEEVVRAAKKAASFELGVPLSALRWAVRELWHDKAPRELHLEARRPGVFVSGIVELMKTDVRFSTTLLIEKVDFSPDALLLRVRLSNLTLQVVDVTAANPIAALIKSGALDTSRPGDLVSYLPSRPSFLLDAQGDRFELDLLRLPSLSKERARKIVAALTPLIGVASVRGDDDHIDIAFSALPEGARGAYERFKKWF